MFSLQADEANIPGGPSMVRLPPSHQPVLDAFDGPGRSTFASATTGDKPSIPKMKPCLNFNALHADHLVLELAHRPKDDLEALKETARDRIGLGVVDIKVNQVETPEEIAKAIEEAENALGDGRVRFIHPDCGFWMLKRSVADRKIASLAKGRDLFLGIEKQHA